MFISGSFFLPIVSLNHFDCWSKFVTKTRVQVVKHFVGEMILFLQFKLEFVNLFLETKHSSSSVSESGQIVFQRRCVNHVGELLENVIAGKIGAEFVGRELVMGTVGSICSRERRRSIR